MGSTPGHGGISGKPKPPQPSDAYKEPWTSTLLDQSKMFAVQLACSGGSSAIAKTIVAPLERVKILRQVQHMAAVDTAVRYRGLLDALQRLPAREGGLLALWRGNGANVLRLLPDVAFRFAVHDQFRTMFASMDGSPPGVGQKLAAGAATGILKTLLFYPLDLLRTRITANQTPASATHGSAVAGPTHGSLLTLRGAAAAALRADGVRGLYRGALLSMGGVAPYLAISFTMYDELRTRMPVDRASMDSVWYPFLKMGCGAAAAASAQLVVYPLDTVRRCMQMNGAPGSAVRYASAADCARQLLRQHGGLAALYRGCLTNCLKTGLGAPLHFVAYDAIKSAVTALDPTTGVSSPL